MRIPSRPAGSFLLRRRKLSWRPCACVWGSRPDGHRVGRIERALDSGRRRPPRTLGADFCSPGKPSDQLGRGPVWSNHEHPAGALAGLPAVEGVDQVKTRPRRRHRQVRLPCRKRVDDQLQALIEGKAGCPAVSGKRPRLLRCRVKRKPERRVPHDVRSLPRRGAQYEHVFAIFRPILRRAGSATSCEADLTDDLTGMLMTQLLDWH
jgi:hypothetical protein